MRDDREITNIIANDFGANATYVEDLLRQFQHNPHSVGEEWGEYFQSILRENGAVKVDSRTGNGSPSSVDGGTAASTGVAGAAGAKPATEAAPNGSGSIGTATARPAAPNTETAPGERAQIRG